MQRLEALKREVFTEAKYNAGIADVLYAEGLAAHFDDPSPVARAYGIERMLTGGTKHVYRNDLIAGSLRGMYETDVSESAQKRAERILKSYGMRHFLTNADHFAPDYEGFLKNGVKGTLESIRRSMELHKNDQDAEKKLNFLRAAEISMAAFGKMIGQYADAARQAAEETGDPRLQEMAEACCRVAVDPPETFR